MTEWMYVLFALAATTACCIAAGRLRHRDNGLAIAGSILAGIVVMPLIFAVTILVDLPLGIGTHGPEPWWVLAWGLCFLIGFLFAKRYGA